MKLYFPTTSLNFNDIFATESLSPKIFYKKRTFGTKRHFSTELSFDERYIMLFKELPYFKLLDNKESDYDEFPIILELEIDPLKYNIQEVTQDVYAINSSIYFTHSNLKVLFSSSEDMKKILAKSQLVIETKTINKYRKCFYTLESSVTIKNFNRYNNTPLYLPNYDIDNELRNDTLFNNIKGFFYSCFYTTQFSSYAKIDEKINTLQTMFSQLNRTLELSSQLNGGNIETIQDLLKLTNRCLRKEAISYRKERDKHDYSIELFTYDGKNDIKLWDKILEKPSEVKLFESIINYLIYNPKPKVGNMEKDEIYRLIYGVHNQVKNLLGNNSTYKKDMEIIYQRFIERNYEIDVTEITSTVLQNFYIFILKYNNTNELNTYIEAKGIPDEFIVFSFIGAYTGFSGLSKDTVRDIFMTENEDLMHGIDIFLENIRTKVWNTTLDNLKNKQNSSTFQIDFFNIDYNNESSQELLFTNRTEENLTSNLFQEIQRIKQSKIINEFLEISNVVLEDNTTVEFSKQNKNVHITFISPQCVDKIKVVLISKENIKQNELIGFKNKLETLKLKKAIARGNFPIFECFKLKKHMKQNLENNDEKLLLGWLQLLN